MRSVPHAPASQTRERRAVAVVAGARERPGLGVLERIMGPASLTMAAAEISEEPGVGFVTDRLEVRRLVMSDLADFHEVWGDPRVIFWGATEDLDVTRQRLRDFISRRLAGITESGWFAVLRRDDGQFVGDVVLEPASWNEDVPEIGWHFAKEWQGRGYATEAAVGLVQVAHQQGIPAVYAKILRTNDPSRGVARRIGMAVVGSLEDHPAGPHDIWAKHLGDPRDR